MTHKQLANTVLHGRRVEFQPVDSDTITGYVAGWDEPEVGPCANYFVLVPEPSGVKQKIVPQQGTLLTLLDESTYENEPLHAELESIMSQFRELVPQLLNRNRGPVKQ